MKPLKNKKNKNLIIILIITLILSGFMPNYVQAATNTDDGGKLLKPIVEFVTFLGDNIMQWLQGTFTSADPLEMASQIGDKFYSHTFKYSPGIIFSGKVKAFDINFIKPSTDSTITNSYYTFMEENIDTFWENAKNTKLNVKDDEEEIEKTINEFAKEYTTLWNVKTESSFYELPDAIALPGYLETDGILYIKCIFIALADLSGEVYIYSNSYTIDEEFLNQINATNEYTSIASELQTTIATWYNALRRIALVGLLSVLVYVGIRIVLTSSSQDKAKYKGMLKDWLVALCLLFTLHYIMNATIIIVNKISDIFSTGDTDPLLNEIRTKILNGSLGTVIAQVIMYATIVILTIKFTVQYIVRVIYMAFYTLIAPLITLTYPLDKIKDGQAQAFNMWIREYIFTALTQVIHLIIYRTLVSSALALVEEYALFAIIVMAFIKKAEDLIKKMFGFEKSETVSALGAAATGGFVMNAINSIKGFGGKKGSSGGGSSGSGGSTGGNVRTATNNPLAGVKTSGGSGSGAGTGTSPRTTGNGSATSGGSTKPKRSIKGGAGSLIGKYYRPVVGTALGALAGGAGAIIGFSAGVAQGDLGAAFGGAVAGGAAGMNLGKGAANLPENVINGVKTGWGNLKDTYREGAYGEEAAAAIKFDEEFRKGSTYKALQSNDNFSEESVQAMLDAGITDKKAMTAILDSGLEVEDAIKYYEAAQKLPQEVFYDKKELKTYCEELRKKDDFFKDQSYGKIRDILTQFM